MDAKEYFETHPTAAELCAVLGPRWAICRNTEKNRERYGLCVSRAAYKNACAKALQARVSSVCQSRHVGLGSASKGADLS